MNRYNRIINLPHYVSAKRPRMSLYNRSSQFAPFNALTTYAEKIRETARLTDEKIELSEEEKEIINRELLFINKIIQTKPQVVITYFVKDKKKSGGHYKKITGNIKKIDKVYNYIILTDCTKIFIDDIISIIKC
ncbi:MAG TPA: hypothetical protein IAB45_06825 [Candidatus Onthousia faecavium]|nr:hypothetical protein [Candidatus Onthousia faecavium]